ncbi:hypothetical protein PtA15_8A230 [Puccinia triticina]|uniref:HEAT repeat-containing protein 1 n=1 Tax=Puccinia triticina TaxID=208348 RepID=A0ABY7CT68_9BASI|nr:uncharacterized protein PtA15_8A230 [Puccinia triticina]WAQ87326.1 hypothetical protein PtA15_8A230 [Puccinia triticina]WAR57181.1 hypothetical protein PtB15_8B228 [Puccinia triticina]
MATQREGRLAQALQASVGYRPQAANVRCSLFPPRRRLTVLFGLGPDRLAALIQHDFLRKDFPRILRTSHAYIAHHHPTLSRAGSEPTRKLALILESSLVCLKKLSLLDDPPRQDLLEQFLEWSRPFYQLVPSLGIPAASLLTQLNKPDDALKAITPALLHSGSPRIRAIVKEAMERSSDPKASATGLVQELLQDSNKPHLKAAIHHLGLSAFITTADLHSSSPSPSANPPSGLDSWSSCILLALQESSQNTCEYEVMSL